MVTFTTFSDILPDPNNKIMDSGDADPSGTPGPGFASVSITSNFDTQLNRTISGRSVARSSGVHKWDISIRYNPMFRDDFDPVDAFLATRFGRLAPFFVILPQYSKPKDSTFYTFALSNTLKNLVAYDAGTTAMMIYAPGAISGNPKPGDMFTITDASDANHLKAYKITRVETDQRYQAATTAPTTAQKRIHFSPPLQRDVAINSTINFINPKFRVNLKNDVLEQELNDDGLYSFGLELEENTP